MLNKAFAAKDFQVEGAENKVAALSERIDQMTKRFEQERNTLEALNRRLTEELQNEKAERSMLPGRVGNRPREPGQDPEQVRVPAQEDPPRHRGGRRRAGHRGRGRGGSNVRPIKPAAEPAE